MAENDDGTKPNTLATEKVIPPQDQTVQGSKRKEVSTVQMTVIRLTRKQLYDEIWEISAAGTAKKYDIPYSQFLKQIKEANIPIPPSGYWTKISFGKPVEKTALKKPFDKVVSLVKEVSLPKGEKPEPGSDPNKKLSDQQEKVRQLSVSSTVVQEQQVPDETHKVDVVAELFQEPETIKQWGQTYNVYDRETLYKEVWAAPVTEVAKKYKVSDVAIHKVCKSLEIPTPSQGYWAKLRAGKPVAKTPLPQSTKTAKKIGAQTGYTPPSETNQNVLEFLGDEERAVVMAVASQILLPDENERMHSKIIAHRKVIAEWKKQENRNANDKWRPRNTPAPPFLANTISNTSIPRACRIIDALIKAMEPLGCKLTDNLEFAVNGETVCVSFSESQDKINHIPTKEENRQLLEYEEKRRKYSYASRPQISNISQRKSAVDLCIIPLAAFFLPARIFLTFAFSLFPRKSLLSQSLSSRIELQHHVAQTVFQLICFTIAEAFLIVDLETKTAIVLVVVLAVLSGGVVVVVDWVGSASSNIGASAVVCSFDSSKAGCNIIFCSGNSEKEICSSCNSSCISGSACQPFSIKLLFPQYLHFLLSSCKDFPHWLQNILDTPLYPIFTIGSNRKCFLIDCNQGDEKKTKNHKQNDHYNY